MIEIEEILCELLKNGGFITSPNETGKVAYKDGEFIVDTVEFGNIYTGRFLEDALKTLDFYSFEDELTFENREKYLEYLRVFNEVKE